MSEATLSQLAKMTPAEYVHNMFVKEFDKLAAKEIPFDDAWKNGTGYFDNAVKLVNLQPGERARSTDTSGRRMIMVGTPFGTAVAFERYVDRPDQSKVITTNLPRAARMIIQDAPLTDNVLFNNFCMDSSNIGTNLQWIITEGNKLSA